MTLVETKLGVLVIQNSCNEGFLQSVYLNSRHGLKITLSEKRAIYNSCVERGVIKRGDIKAVAKIFSCCDRTAREIAEKDVKDRVEEKAEKREAVKQEVFKLYCENMSQTAIAAKLNLHKSTVSRYISEMTDRNSSGMETVDNGLSNDDSESSSVSVLPNLVSDELPADCLSEPVSKDEDSHHEQGLTLDIGSVIYPVPGKMDPNASLAFEGQAQADLQEFRKQIPSIIQWTADGKYSEQQKQDLASEVKVLMALLVLKDPESKAA